MIKIFKFDSYIENFTCSHVLIYLFIFFGCIRLEIYIYIYNIKENVIMWSLVLLHSFFSLYV